MLVREHIIGLARQFDGTPYKWAGSGPDGFDCSGFVIWCLRVFNVLPPRGDWTADQLACLFEETNDPEPGDLACYGRPNRITHVMLYAGGNEVIGATGGDSLTTTVAAAMRKRAFVRPEPVSYRRDFVGYRDISRRVIEGGKK